MSSAAFETVSVHVPDVDAVSVVPSQAQPVAVPFATEVMLSAPEDEPPPTDSTVNGVCEYGNVLLVVLSTGDEIAVWVALLITNENEDVVALVPFESVKVTVIGKVPAVVGEPEITPVPVFERVTPPGSDPVTEKVPLPVPFDVARLKVKAEFMVPVNPVFGVVIATLLATHFA